MVIARQSVGGRLVLAVDDLLEPLLRAPRVPGVIIHIGDVVARLVAVDILPDQPGDVLGMAVVELGVVELEHCVELLDRRVIAAQLADQPDLVVRPEPRILPGFPPRPEAPCGGKDGLRTFRCWGWAYQKK